MGRKHVDLSDVLIFRMLGVLCNLIMVNGLFIITSLPIITIGASLTGLTRVTMKMVQHQDPSVVKDYFGAFKKHFKESTIIWLIVLFAGTFFTIDLYVIFTKIDEQYKLLQIPVWIFLFFVFSIIVYGFPLISSYPDKIRSTIKNSILLSLGNIPVTIFAFAIPLLIAKFAVTSGERLVGVFSIFIFCGFALLSYINIFFVNRIFIKVTGEDPEIVEDEPVEKNEASKSMNKKASSSNDDSNNTKESVSNDDSANVEKAAQGVKSDKNSTTDVQNESKSQNQNKNKSQNQNKNKSQNQNKNKAQNQNKSQSQNKNKSQNKNNNKSQNQNKDNE
jgi:Predicted integral membrane protein